MQEVWLRDIDIFQAPSDGYLDKGNRDWALKKWLDFGNSFKLELPEFARCWSRSGFWEDSTGKLLWPLYWWGQRHPSEEWSVYRRKLGIWLLLCKCKGTCWTFQQRGCMQSTGSHLRLEYDWQELSAQLWQGKPWRQLRWPREWVWGEKSGGLRSKPTCTVHVTFYNVTLPPTELSVNWENLRQRCLLYRALHSQRDSALKLRHTYVGMSSTMVIVEVKWLISNLCWPILSSCSCTLSGRHILPHSLIALCLALSSHNASGGLQMCSGKILLLLPQ